MAQLDPEVANALKVLSQHGIQARVEPDPEATIDDCDDWIDPPPTEDLQVLVVEVEGKLISYRKPSPEIMLKFNAVWMDLLKYCFPNLPIDQLPNDRKRQLFVCISENL